jgi:hypothetical protein
MKNRIFEKRKQIFDRQRGFSETTEKAQEIALAR